MTYLFLKVLVIVLMVAVYAGAQTASPAAESIYSQGVRLLREGKTDDAIRSF